VLDRRKETGGPCQHLRVGRVGDSAYLLEWLRLGGLQFEAS
jgi:hypothetical protein